MKKTVFHGIPARRCLASLMLAAGLLVMPAALAPVMPWFAASADDDEDDHETARKALEQHEILPLGKVLALIEGQFQGDVIEIELERKKGIWIYDLELIDGDGRVREIDVDARTGAVLKVEYDE